LDNDCYAIRQFLTDVSVETRWSLRIEFCWGL